MTRISGCRALGEISRGVLFHDQASSGKSPKGTHRKACFPPAQGLEIHEAESWGWAGLNTSPLKAIETCAHTMYHLEIWVHLYICLLCVQFWTSISSIIFFLKKNLLWHVTCIQLALAVTKAAVCDTAEERKENKQFLWKSIVIYSC